MQVTSSKSVQFVQPWPRPKLWAAHEWFDFMCWERWHG